MSKIMNMSLDEERKWAKLAYLEQGDFIYYRAGRVDGRSGTHSVAELDKAIAYAHSQRETSPSDNGQYNVWTAVEAYLKFLKHMLPIE